MTRSTNVPNDTPTNASGFAALLTPPSAALLPPQPAASLIPSPAMPIAAAPADSNAATASTTAAGSTRYESLDFWRGAACLILVAFHGSFYAEAAFEAQDRSTWSAGSIAIRVIRLLWVGVPIFFVISGYCIAASIDSLRRKPRPISVYFTRRFRRIYPPLWIACLLAVGFWWLADRIPFLTEHCQQRPDMANMPWTAWLGNFFAVESWLPALTGRDASEYLMRNTWTLCYEEQFYLIAGIALAVWPRGFFTLCGAVTLATLAGRHLGRAGWIHVDGWFFDGHWLLFACGVLAFQTLNRQSRFPRMAAIALLIAGMAYAVLDRFTVSTRAERHLDDYIVASCGFAIALIAFRRWDARFASLAILRPVAACGRMSYSIYLTHFPLVVCVTSYLGWLGVTQDAWVAFAVIPATTLASLPGAWLFHRLVERRFMNTPGDAPRPALATAPNLGTLAVDTSQSGS